jgi:transposase-like protein
MMLCRKCGSKKVSKIERGMIFSAINANTAVFNTPKVSQVTALYLLGMSMRSRAKLFRINVISVIYWVRKFAVKNYTKPTPGMVLEVGFNEMWHFIESKNEY